MSGLPFVAMNEGRNSGGSMSTGSETDAELVNACVSGSQAAFAQIYDRYSDRVFSFCLSLTRDRGLAEDAMADTFVTAWQKMSQLRDPSQVRSWLFAIAKNRVSRLGVKAGRQVPVDPLGTEMRSAFDLDEATPDADVTDAMSGETAVALVWEAAEGLNENERAVLELSVRQGIEGDELANALGVSRHNANVIASRMRQNLERSLGALFLLRYNDDGCSEFSSLIAGYSGALTPLWRKRISRHADACATCSTRRVPKAMALFGESPVSAAPISARSEILASLPVTPEGLPLVDSGTFRQDRDGFPKTGGSLRRVLIGIGVATFAVVVLTFATVRTVHDGKAPKSTDSASSQLATPTTLDGTSAVVEGELNESSTTTTKAGSSTTSTAIDAGGSVRPGGGSSSTTTIARDTTVPIITAASLSPSSLISANKRCTNPATKIGVLSVSGTDNVGLVSGQAKVTINAIGGQTTIAVSLSGSGTTVKGTVGPLDPTSGSFVVNEITVVDAAGNRSAVWPKPIQGAVSC